LALRFSVTVTSILQPSWYSARILSGLADHWVSEVANVSPSGRFHKVGNFLEPSGVPKASFAINIEKEAGFP
jgi:hypothetical protein